MLKRISKQCKVCSKEFLTPENLLRQYCCSKECRDYLKSGAVYVEGTTITHRFHTLKGDKPAGLRGIINRYEGTDAVLIIKFDPTND